MYVANRDLKQCASMPCWPGMQLAWLTGVLMQVEGTNDIRMAGIGGLSALLGWTEVQQQTSKGFLGGGSNIIKGVCAQL